MAIKKSMQNEEKAEETKEIEQELRSSNLNNELENIHKTGEENLKKLENLKGRIELMLDSHYNKKHELISEVRQLNNLYF
jgi:hypothetical protein